MRLMLNGKEREVGDVPTIEALIARLGIHRMIVVQHNGAILRREQYATQRLQDGDVVEILHFVGGG
jgi:sulfur carrier protein